MESNPNVLKLIYFAILSSIALLNFMSYYTVGSYTMTIPIDPRSVLFFGVGFFMLLLSLFVEHILTIIKNDFQTISLLRWAIIEGVITLGFVHSFMDKENVLMFYTIPSLFLMFRYRLK